MTVVLISSSILNQVSICYCSFRAKKERMEKGVRSFWDDAHVISLQIIYYYYYYISVLSEINICMNRLLYSKRKTTSHLYMLVKKNNHSTVKIWQKSMYFYG